jgi:hypothetical protein
MVTSRYSVWLDGEKYTKGEFLKRVYIWWEVPFSNLCRFTCLLRLCLQIHGVIFTHLPLDITLCIVLEDADCPDLLRDLITRIMRRHDTCFCTDTATIGR